MSIHPKFPKSPYEIIKPEFRWIPADESLRESSFNKLLPPLVSKLRKRIYEWRGDKYEGISDISAKGMTDYFADLYDNPTAVSFGSYDEAKKEYNLTVRS